MKSLPATTYLFCWFLILGLLIPLASHAQTGPQITGPNTTSIKLEPRYPKPGDRVTATIKNYSTSDSSHDLEWFINGVSQSENRNAREINFVAPDLSTRVVVEARVNDSVQATTSFTPVYVDIVVDPDTYTPPRFAGRPIPTGGANVTFTAIVEEAEKLPANSYSYEWKLNGSSVKSENVSGPQITIPIKSARNHTISVTVSDATRGVIGQQFIQIPVLDPKPLFYKIHPLYGTETYPLTSPYNFQDNQLNVSVVPYYLDNMVLRDNPNIEWEVNRQTVQTNGYDISLERSGESGLTNLEFILKGRDIMQQRISKLLQIQQ